MYGSGCYGSFVYGGLSGLSKEDMQFDEVPDVLDFETTNQITTEKKQMRPLIKKDNYTVSPENIIDLNKPKIWQHNNNAT